MVEFNKMVIQKQVCYLCERRRREYVELADNEWGRRMIREIYKYQKFSETGSFLNQTLTYKYKVLACGKSFSRSENLKRHIKTHVHRGYGGRVIILSPPTSEAGVRFPAWPQVGKLVVACC